MKGVQGQSFLNHYSGDRIWRSCLAAPLGIVACKVIKGKGASHDSGGNEFGTKEYMEFQ